MGHRAMRIKPPRWTHVYTDRHGKLTCYLRQPGRSKVRLPGLPWSPEFMEARELALKGDSGKVDIGASRTVAGTVSAALVSYYQSPAFGIGVADSTTRMRRAILEAFRADHGDKRVALMHANAVQNIISRKTPAAQRNFKKAMRGFIDHCLSHNLMKLDPLDGIKLKKMTPTGGHHTWTIEEIEQYHERHPAGTKARLALVILLQTGHARADVVRMGRQHVKRGVLSMRRQKTNVQFDIPLLPELLAELELHPKTELAFLTTERGRPFTAAGFGNWFRDRCDEAGLPQCAAHGLRKAAAVHHAMNGATAPELMAWFGWRTIGEAQRYIEEANRIRLAQNAGAKIISGTRIGPPPIPVGQFGAQPIDVVGGEQ
jgi:integrase